MITVMPAWSVIFSPLGMRTASTSRFKGMEVPVSGVMAKQNAAFPFLSLLTAAEAAHGFAALAHEVFLDAQQVCLAGTLDNGEQVFHRGDFLELLLDEPLEEI